MIDDIDYLLENSDKDSIILYVDSSSRNKLYYPNASEYTIQFNQPFKNVYGFEVIDGSIPNTMYNIDVYNNKIYFTTVVKSPVSLIPINTYDIFNEIHTSSTLINMFNKIEENYIIVGSEVNLSIFVSTINVSNISKNHAIFYKDSMQTNIVKRNKQIFGEFYFFTFKDIDYAIQNIPENADIINVLEQNEFYLDLNTMILYYYTVHLVDEVTFNNAKTAGSYISVINNYRRELAIGNYDILTITNDLNNLVNRFFVDVAPTTAPPKKEGKMMFTSVNYLLINTNVKGISESLGFDVYPPSVESSINYKSWKIGENYMVYGAVTDPTNPLNYQVVSPGMINLLGERFCILRIKELEDHLFGSYSYMNYTPGIGMFKMAAGPGGITNLRFDYSSLVRKPFHPIGKIDKLTLRFETSNGNLYDFKGVNHQLMFIIRFLVPSKKIKFTKSILNPNYDPNIMEYLSNNRTIEYREDSDDEEEFDGEKYYQQYKKELETLDYTSSSEDEDNTSSEEEVD